MNNTLLRCIPALLAVSGCMLAPIQGESGDEDDNFVFGGGSLWPSTEVSLYCKNTSTSSYVFLKSFNTLPHIDPVMAETYGDFYLITESFNVPAVCWYSNGSAQIKATQKNPNDGKIHNVHVYDSDGYDCLDTKDFPFDSGDYTTCAMNSSGEITVCRFGKTWNGSSCI